MRIQLLTISILLIQSVIAITSFKGQIELSELNKNVLDPSRSSILITNNNNNYTERHYFTYNGDFEIEGLSSGTYLVEIDSKDFDLKRSNFLYVVINDYDDDDNDDDEEIKVYEIFHGNAITDTSILTILEYPLKFPEFTVRFKDYIETKPNGLMTLPFIGFIKNHPMISIGLGGMLLLGLMPHIISYLDPDFAARVAESNKEAKSEEEKQEEETIQHYTNTEKKLSPPSTKESIKSNKKTLTTSSNRNSQTGRRRK